MLSFGGFQALLCSLPREQHDEAQDSPAQEVQV